MQLRAAALLMAAAVELAVQAPRVEADSRLAAPAGSSGRPARAAAVPAANPREAPAVPGPASKDPSAAGEPGDTARERPAIVLPIVDADRVSSRRLLVKALHQAIGRGDFELAARLNGGFAREAEVRSRRVLDAWKARRDPVTGLMPKSAARQLRFWNARDVASDLFPYLLYAANELDAANAQAWLDTMAFERRQCGPLACDLEYPGGNVRPTDRTERLFGAVEYAKDGLLADTERMGEGPWLDRMIEDVDAILAQSPIKSSAGALVAEGTEVNGELLLVLSRLWQRTRDEKYILAAERIADAYLFEVIPKNHGLPAKMWNFARSKPRTPEFRLRDHGSELFPGLGELYLVEKLAGRPAAERYREPIRAFFDTVLALPRTKDGMFRDSYDAPTREPRDKDVTDTWGYLLTGLAAFDLAEGTQRYAPEIERVMRGAASRHSFHWEANFMDGYADSIESMLYHLPFHPIPECAYWVDEEIEVMFAKQQESGFVEGWYLDGNFVRTAMLYASWKAMGTSAQPWSPQLQLGAAMDPATRRLFVHLRSQDAWTGTLRFDRARHSEVWRYPAEFPRLNGLPEWYPVDAKASYVVRDLRSGEERRHAGAELLAGLPMSLPARGSAAFTVELAED